MRAARGASHGLELAVGELDTEGFGIALQSLLEQGNHVLHFGAAKAFERDMVEASEGSEFRKFHGDFGFSIG